MLVPLYKRQHAHSRAQHVGVDTPLALSLRWWREVLALGLHQSRSFSSAPSPPVHLFADARGHPARLAAVLLIDGEILYCDCEPPEVMLQALEARNDKQILGLELFALALGCSTFAERLVGRKVFLWSDNVGAEKGTAKGKARPPC